MKINEVSNSPVLNIVLDTINQNKQALVFCNTRKSAEATAEKISELIAKETQPDLTNSLLKVLSTPTKQCKRLAMIAKKGVAFHHAGLASEQRRLIEKNFRDGNIKVICSTPTLAFGLNLPAFRSIIKDLKRYGGRWGMEWIPTLEYHQMAGRAGRPDFNDTHGEAVCIASTENELEEIYAKFINAPPENIFSKLAVEPVLRTACLSLLATDYAKSKNDLIDFFRKTFYGHQFGDMEKIDYIIDKILTYLDEWGFIKQKPDFVSANELNMDTIKVTKLGERVAQLYIDPYTANYLITGLRKAMQKNVSEISFLQMALSTFELRPLPNVLVREVEQVEAFLVEISSELVMEEPSVFDPEYNEYLKVIKCTRALYDWMEEKNEEYILENYNIPPGELHVKRELCDWILYATEELSRLMGFLSLITKIKKTRFRLDKGVKEELVSLVRIKNIGRVRARILFKNGIKNIGDVKTADLLKLSQLLGKNIAVNLKKQVGVNIDQVPNGKRKGQLGLGKYNAR